MSFSARPLALKSSTSRAIRACSSPGGGAAAIDGHRALACHLGRHDPDVRLGLPGGLDDRLGHLPGEFEDLFRVAIVPAEPARPALRLDADRLPGEAAAAAVEALGAVDGDQQVAFGAAAQHLGRRSGTSRARSRGPRRSGSRRISPRRRSAGRRRAMPLRAASRTSRTVRRRVCGVRSGARPTSGSGGPRRPAGRDRRPAGRPGRRPGPC